MRHQCGLFSRCPDECCEMYVQNRLHGYGLRPWCCLHGYENWFRMPGRMSNHSENVFFSHTDTCQVNNGDCDVNAICSHDGKNNSVVCICKTGYTNSGSASNATCTGKSNIQIGQILDIALIACEICLDTCQINNGDCDAHATCSHNATTYAVLCTCKTGYTNTGVAPNVTCTGKNISASVTYTR